jgi:acetyltransferase-like isoleucine patch superfamily enzyme
MTAPGVKKKISVAKIPLQEQLHSNDNSSLKRYKNKVFGIGSYFQFAKFELVTFLFESLGGGLGYGLRKFFYPGFFRKIGKGCILGKGISFRNPNLISFGDRVAIDDNCLVDASGTGDGGITFGDDLIISRNCVVQGKTGAVSIGNGTDIGCNTIISSVTGISIGDSVLIAGNCYIGGARYITDGIDVPIMEQGVYSKGPVAVGSHCWLGAGVIILDGVTVGKGCVIGAGSVVTKDLPDYAIAFGLPATVRNLRVK